MEKRILTIQDFSCMGRCSLTVAIQTISACGVECVALPTAILSNHTAFKSFTYLDLTSQMLPSIEKWNDYRHEFDMIYTGYLSNDQIPTVQEVIKRIKTENTKIFIDPAMADHGSLYPGFDLNHVKMMQELVTNADIIKLNLTEACFLAGIEYPGSETKIPISFYDNIVEKLRLFNVKRIIITGQELNEGRVSDICYCDEYDNPFIYETEMYPGVYHGTADLFASCFAGLYARGLDFKSSIIIDHDYVHEAIGYTVKNKLDGLTYGPDFESAIPFLTNKLISLEK